MKLALAVACLLATAACAGSGDHDAGMANASESGMMADSSNMSGGMGDAMHADSSATMADSGMTGDSAVGNMNDMQH